MQSRWLLVVVVVVGCGPSTANVPANPGHRTVAPAPVDAEVSVVEPEEPLQPGALPPPPPPPKIDVVAELAWAKQRFKKELGTFDMTSHVAELLAWIAPKSKLPVFLTSAEGGRCKPGVLSRDDADGMSLMVYTDERAVRGVRTRSYSDGDVGDELHLGGSGGTEIKYEDGTWGGPGERWMRSEQDSWGHLSKVTKDYARFAGTWVDVETSCKGAVTKLQCSGNGTVECNTCSGVTVTVTARPMGMMRVGRGMTLVGVGCPTCPVTSNADLDRMRALLPELNGWTVANERSAPTIYKRKEDCTKGL